MKPLSLTKLVGEVLQAFKFRLLSGEHYVRMRIPLKANDLNTFIRKAGHLISGIDSSQLTCGHLRGGSSV